MQTIRLIAALTGAALLVGAAQTAATAQPATGAPTTSPMTTPTKAPADMMTPAAAPGGAMNGTAGVLGTLALAARSLRARRTSGGYTLTGQAQVTDACQLARFDPSLLTIYPPQYNLVQFRDPKKKALLCAPHLMWITAIPRRVSSMKPPGYVTVRTRKGAKRVPIR